MNQWRTHGLCFGIPNAGSESPRPSMANTVSSNNQHGSFFSFLFRLKPFYCPNMGHTDIRFLMPPSYIISKSSLIYEWWLETAISNMQFSGHQTYIMQNRLSNCFVWVSHSTSDLNFHFCHYDTSADHLTRISIKIITELLSSRAKVTLDFKKSW